MKPLKTFLSSSLFIFSSFFIFSFLGLATILYKEIVSATKEMSELLRLASKYPLLANKYSLKQLEMDVIDYNFQKWFIIIILIIGISILIIINIKRYLKLDKLYYMQITQDTSNPKIFIITYKQSFIRNFFKLPIREEILIDSGKTYQLTNDPIYIQKDGSYVCILSPLNDILKNFLLKNEYNKIINNSKTLI